MKIRNIGVGPHRWYIEVWPDSESEAREFYHWMKETLPNCFFKMRFDKQNQGKYYWEVRGSDLSEHTYIMLAWL